MQDARDPVCEVKDAVCDGLRQIGDFSYAILPKDVAHALADLKKSLLNQIRCCLDWEIGWIDDRVAGGDRLREEWRQKCQQQTSTEQM
ncbi:MAG TPA: hypothetical protein VJ751_01005 [Pyrinomonadaceae bacterium]|jgi:hypothetical protein|nr:hypothetical protein [Pyrinomonadaceae bacterium]